MQRLEVSGAVRPIYESLGVKRLKHVRATIVAATKQHVLHILGLCLEPSFLPDGATARGGPRPPLQYASKSLDSLLYLSIRLYPSFSDPWTRHPAISFLVFLFVLLRTAFRTASFLGLHSFYMPKPSYSLAFNKVWSLRYPIFSAHAP